MTFDALSRCFLPSCLQSAGRLMFDRHRPIPVAQSAVILSFASALASGSVACASVPKAEPVQVSSPGSLSPAASVEAPVLTTITARSGDTAPIRQPSAQPPANPFWTTVIWSALAAILSSVLTAAWTRMTKISEFRQGWINDLRQDIAAYLGAANAWRVLTEHPAHSLDIKGEAIEVNRKTTEARIAARVLLWRIQMRFSPWSNKFKATDDQFLLSLEQLIDETMWKRRDFDDWDRAADAAAYAGREILKREWEVTKTQPFRSRQSGAERAIRTLGVPHNE